MEEQMPYLLEVKDITKQFPGVLALNKVHLQLCKGEVLGLMGENGAGKSTLIKCLCGLHSIDEGEILIEGEKVEIGSVKIALEKGISVVQQELSPVLELSVMENIWLGREPRQNGLFIDYKKMYSMTKELLERWDIELEPKRKLSSYSVANIQMVEILKAISRDAKIIILDEPTSAISNNEVERLFTIIRQLKKTGVGFIYVSHKMDEVFKITDDITVLRDGNFISSHHTKDTNMDELVQEMVGRKIEEIDEKRCCIDGNNRVLEVQNVSSGNCVKDVSFYLKKGEILGFSGLIGAGRTEVMETIFGRRKIDSGTILLNGKKSMIKNPADAIKQGIAMITEERRADGIVSLMSVSDNVALASINHYRKGIFFDKVSAEKAAKEYIKLLNIKTPNTKEKIENLSGGNQQKVIIAKWLMTQADIFLFDEPTRGIDVGAKSEIYSLILALVAKGKSVIMVSSEMPEILKMSDRIIVMCEGRITGEINREEASEEKIMGLAAKK